MSYVERAASIDLERRARPRSVRRYHPPKLRIETYPVTTDVDLVATGLGQQVVVLGDRNRFQVFADPAEAREFAVGLLTAINQLERELEVIDADPIPQDYSDVAISDWDEAVRWGLVYGEDREGD